jgi:hypothetical protein
MNAAIYDATKVRWARSARNEAPKRESASSAVPWMYLFGALGAGPVTCLFGKRPWIKGLRVMERWQSG